MKKIKTVMNISLGSREWTRRDEDNAGVPFVSAGFENTEEVMDLRIYDLLNILGIDRIMAEEMVYALYRFFNENADADEAIYAHVADQYFDYAAWHKEHPDASQVKVKDIVLSEGMNMKALEWLFNQVVRKFWRSPEYNSRHYRYWGYKDLIEQKKGAGDR